MNSTIASELLARAERAFKARRLDECVDLLHQALSVEPDNALAWQGLVRVEAVRGNYRSALDAAEQALLASPGSEQALRMQGGLALKLGLGEVALSSFNELGVPPAGWTKVGHEAYRAGYYGMARQLLERALQDDANWLPARFGCMLFPDSPVVRDAAAQDVFLEQVRAGLDWFEARALEEDPPAALMACLTMATNFYLHYLDRDTADEQRRYARVIERMAARVMPGMSDVASRLDGDGLLRVGFVSASLYSHTLTKLFGAFITELDHRQFEVHCFQLGNVHDAETERLASAVHSFESGERPPPAWAETILDARLDVLVYLDIGMHPVVQALATRRLAKHQLALWGHPVSSRFTTIDGFLTSDAMEREDGGADYDEALHRLPGLGACVSPPSLEPSTPEGFQPDKERVEFFIAQSAPKWLPLMDSLLTGIAAELPEARFHMTPSSMAPATAALHKRLAESFAGAGLDYDDHLGLMRHVSQAEFLGIASAADINLDTPGWSGGLSSLEILWFDTPTVTLPGAAMRSRHTAAMLRVMELDELIAKDQDDYVRIAVELGRSSDYRAGVRARIAERKHRLYDDHSVVRAFAERLRYAAGIE
jgi:predicted O-linked N-acetylglucosamine transferase (SPINDLY family)